MVFEDSATGVEAARRAGMRVVWCPHKEILKEYRGIEKEVLAGLTVAQQDRGVKEVLVEAGAEMRIKEYSGQVDNGWGEMVGTLEEFNCKKYGIGGWI